MNIGEANDLNIVLRYVLNLSYGMDTEGNDLSYSDDQAMEAAARLADKANKVLGAGVTGDRVRAAWPDLLLDNGEPEEDDYPPEVAAHLAALMYGDER